MYFFKKHVFSLFFPVFLHFLIFLPFFLFLTIFALNLLKNIFFPISVVASENSQISLNAGEHTVCDCLGLSLTNAGSSVAKDEKKYIFTLQLHELYGLLSKYHSKSW